MGFRELISKKPKVTAAVVAGVAILSLGLSLYSVLSTSDVHVTKAFYTDDDGKSWFVDDIDRVPPFDHDGKQAVRAKMYTCDDHKTQFVGYLERYTPAIQKRLQSSLAAVAAGQPATLSPMSPDVLLGGIEVKSPGSSKWVSSNDFQGKLKVTNVACPQGGVLDAVNP